MKRPESWVRCTLDDIKAPVDHAIAGGPFGSDLTQADYVAEGVPVIRGCNLGHGERRFYPSDFVFVSADKAESLRRNGAAAGDVVFTQRGTVGQVGLIPEGLPWGHFVLSQSQMKLTCNRERADPEFVYYWCRSAEAQRYIANHTISAGVPHINLGTLKTTPLLLPPLTEQRAIAASLSALDRRISLCDDQRTALAELVDLLFRTWFLDHAPTRARAAGARHPSVDPADEALFPARLDERDDRPRPEGWHLAALPDLAEFQNGSAFKLEEFSEDDEGLAVIKIAELKQGISRQTRFCVDKPGGRRLESGDLLFSWSGNPDTSIDTFLYFGAPAWLNQHIFKIVPRRPAWRAFLFGLMRALKPALVAFARTKQTTGLGHVAMKDMRTIPVVAPPEPVIDAFDRLTAPYFARMQSCAELALTLERTRDALLPRLMSGEARVRHDARLP